MRFYLAHRVSFSGLEEIARGDALEAGAHDKNLPQMPRVDLHQPHAAVGRVRYDALTLQ